jgi:hypothetical protein
MDYTMIPIDIKGARTAETSLKAVITAVLRRGSILKNTWDASKLY